MKEKGWRPFWAALLAALLVLLPLVGGTVLLTRRSLRTRLASRPQSGVAIRQPKEENRLSLLVCIAPTETTAPGCFSRLSRTQRSNSGRRRAAFR